MQSPSREQQIAALEKDWATNPRWKGVKRGYSAADVVRLRGSLPIEHTLARRGAEKLWKSRQHRGLRERARRAHRQPGDAAGQGRPRRRSICRAGRSPPTPTSPARCTPTSRSIRRTRCRHGRQAHQQHLPARRPDPVVAEGKNEHRLLRADRGRRGSRLRRRAQRLRAHEGHDRGGRRRRPLRGPARLGEEVRPHGRQGAGADARSLRQADRGAPRGRRDGRVDDRASPAPTPKPPT